MKFILLTFFFLDLPLYCCVINVLLEKYYVVLRTVSISQAFGEK